MVTQQKEFSSRELVHTFLYIQGSPLSFEEYERLLLPNSHKMEPVKFRHPSSSGVEWSCPVKICRNIRKYFNPVHCVAPECVTDPHHYKRRGKFTYWCPVCRTHSGNPERCVRECNYCEEHGTECARFKNDVTCYAEECKTDPHHHRPEKYGHKLCEQCYGCHEKNLHYCMECLKCYSKYHCKGMQCIKDPHHNLQGKSEHELCEQCYECHEKNLHYCTQCLKCYSQLHCTDKQCIKDPHHTDKLKREDMLCGQCNKCHKISLPYILTYISYSIDVSYTFAVVMPKDLVDLILGYLQTTRQEWLEYCAKCSKCYEYNRLDHCMAIECASDPHHQRPEKKNMMHTLCEQCKKCHYKLLVNCPICDECFQQPRDKHCLAKKCEWDPHHLSLKRCNRNCGSTYGYHNSECAMNNKYCNLCNKCHKNEQKYCLACKSCFNKDHCIAAECILDPHHLSPKRCSENCNLSYGSNYHCLDCKINHTYCKTCNKCHARYNTEYCELCKSCYEKYSFKQNVNHCFAPECKTDPHHTLKLRELPITCFPKDHFNKNDAKRFWCNVCRLHWYEYSGHNPSTCDYHPPKTFVSKQVCNYFKNGNCHKGQNCKFSHPDVCKFWQKGYCKNQENCKYLHKFNQ